MQTPFLAIGALAAALWLMLLLATFRAAFRALDLRILTSINAHFKPGEGRAALKVERAMRDLTALGGDMVMALLVILGTLLIANIRGGYEALWFAGLIISARLVGLVAKGAIRRDRPQLAGQHLRSFTSSFPSVHTLMIFVAAFALLSVVGLQSLPSLAWAGSMAALVGATRLYFAVHWPSDVAAGWLAGLAICAGAASLGGL